MVANVVIVAVDVASNSNRPTQVNLGQMSKTSVFTLCFHIMHKQHNAVTSCAQLAIDVLQENNEITTLLLR